MRYCFALLAVLAFFGGLGALAVAIIFQVAWPLVVVIGLLVLLLVAVAVGVAATLDRLVAIERTLDAIEVKLNWAAKELSPRS